MKKQFSILLIAFISASLLFTSCRKDRSSNVANYTEEELSAQADDLSRFSGESDAADDDAVVALETYGGSFGTRRPMAPPTITGIPCDAVVTVDTLSIPHTITIDYTGDTCFSSRRIRLGKVILSFSHGFRWGQAGATFTKTYNNLKITRRSDGKTITINGKKTITNVTGGRVANLATNSTPIEHTVTSNNMSVTFDNGSQRTWNIAKKRTFTYSNGIVISVTGTQPNGVAIWGVNRHGNNFSSAITQALTVKQDCDFRLVSGQIQHTGAATIITTYGLDAAGNAITSCPIGLFYYKAVWTGPNGNSVTVIRPY